MASAAYILINVTAGGALKSLKEIRKIKGIKQAHLVTGLYDIVAYLETPDVNSLGSTVITKIHQVDGISKTLTCVAVQE